MKIPTASHNCFLHPPQQEEQPHDVNSSDDEEEEEDFSTSLSYCSSSYLVEQMNNSNKLRKADSFSGSCYGIAQEQQQYPINGDEESSNQCKVIWCDVCKQEGFEEVATHYCSTCFNEKSREVILLDGNEEETLEESNNETIVCHYCQYHANRHNRRDSLHQIVSIRQERMFPSSSSSLLRSGSFMSSGSSYDSNMSNSSPIPFFTPPLGSTSTGPLFTYSFNNNNNILAGSNINNMVRYCFKHEEAIPINTYCRTCELVICSQCALSKEHKGHLIELIKDVEATERMQLGEHIKVLKQSFEEWEEEFNVYNHDLEEELKLIDDREETLTSQINAAFDEMKESLERRRSSLIEKVEQSCHENKQSVHNILKMKKESKELLGEFDNLEEMSGFDIIDKKLNRLNLIIVLYEKMQREFKTRKLSDLHLVSLNKFTSRKKVIQRQIDELGQVVEKTTSRDDSSVPSSTSIPINFKYVETIGAGGNTSNSKQVQFSFPSDVKISHQHSCIIVTDFGNKKIRVLDLTTRRLKYDINTIAAPRNVSIDHTDDDSIIVSCADHCVYKYSLLDKGKNIIWRSGSPNESGNSEHLFKYPRASIVDADGNIYVCDHGLHRIKVLRSSDGKVVKIIGTDQQDQIQFKRPWGIDINKEGNIVISEKKNNRIQRISNEGDISLFLLGKKGSSQYEFNKPRGVLIDPHNDNTFICDGENHRIQVFSKAGKLIKSFGSEGSKSSQLCQPHSLCFDYLSGQLFVADCANSRIQIFQ